MILVTGATGNIGSRLAQRLLKDGHQIRVVSRQEDKLAELKVHGAQPIVGDLLDYSFCQKAFDGCERAFLVVQGSPQNGNHVEEEIKCGHNFAQAMKSGGLKHAVFSGSLCADQNTGSPIIDTKEKVEQALRESGLPVTVLRPGNFFENLYAYLEALSSGHFVYPMDGRVRVPYVSVDDIALIADKALNREPSGWEIYDMPGERDISMLEIAGAISDNLNRMIKYMRVSDEQFIEVFTGFGISQKYCEDVLAMFRFFEKQEFNFDREKVQKEFDYRPTTLEEFVPKLVAAIK